MSSPKKTLKNKSPPKKSTSKSPSAAERERRAMLNKRRAMLKRLAMGAAGVGIAGGGAYAAYRYGPQVKHMTTVMLNGAPATLVFVGDKAKQGASAVGSAARSAATTSSKYAKNYAMKFPGMGAAKPPPVANKKKAVLTPTGLRTAAAMGLLGGAGLGAAGLGAAAFRRNQPRNPTPTFYLKPAAGAEAFRQQLEQHAKHY